MQFTNEKEEVKNKLEEIIQKQGNHDAIINPYASDLNEDVSKLIKEYGAPIISRILEEESLLYDCYSIGKKKEGENVGKEGRWDDKLKKWDEKPEFVPGQSYQKAPDNCKNKALMCWWKGKEDLNEFTDNEKSCGLIGKHMRRREKEIKEKDILQLVNIYNKRQERRSSPDTVTADNIYTPANFEGGGRKKTRRRRRKKKSKRKKTRRRRKKKKTRRKKKKKRKKSKRKKRSRKLRGGNYWRFNDKSKKYECYMTVNHKGSKKHLLGKIAEFDSLPEFTKHMCKWYNKKIPGLIQHPKIFNEDPDLKETYNKATQKYEYKYICGNCKNEVKYKKYAFDGYRHVSDDVEKRWVAKTKYNENLKKFNKLELPFQQIYNTDDKEGLKRTGSADARFFEPEEEAEEEWVPYIPSDDEW